VTGGPASSPVSGTLLGEKRMTNERRGVVPCTLNDPHADRFTQPFWTAALQSRVTAEECTRCGLRLIPGLPRCFRCQTIQFRDRGPARHRVVYSFIIVRHPLRPALNEVVPYVSAVVELDDTQGAGAQSWS